MRHIHPQGRGIPLALSLVEGSQERNGRGVPASRLELRKAPLMGEG